MPTNNSPLGQAFSAYLETIANYYDPEALALIKAVAARSPSPTTVEIAYQLLGGWTGTGMTLPPPMPPAPALSFPADHGEHWDTPIEWRYLTQSLDLVGGGKVNVITNLFRKAIATAATAPTLTEVERQIYSTSIAATLELPGQPVAHYVLPPTTFSALEGGVEIGADPFKMVVGKVSLTGTSDVFPIAFRIEDDGDPLVGRPALVVDITAQATNPLFLQGKDGYIGAPAGAPTSVAWYYYSWPQQATTGTVTVGGVTYQVASGVTWMDHQWGGYPAPATAAKPGWSGWCWFEFQFEGDRSLTLACPHTAVVGGKLPFFNGGFGTYVEGGQSWLIPALLEVGDYAPSQATGVGYPSDWTLEAGTLGGPVMLVVKPKTLVADQAMWMGGLTEYSEAAATVTAIGMVNGEPVKMSGVGYCEGVGFENPAEQKLRVETWLRAKLEGQDPGTTTAAQVTLGGRVSSVQVDA
jgi:predicted secreted hydrolase